ncbi:MAG TPA: GvpL/GvpF family gas vesicle protein [Tepidisphaeraceae bacterium]|nr:GvpL/GvpF family gas vesicle protein [Tepidisphaeraceae bacterium]
MEELTEQLIQRLLAAATRSSGADARRLVAEARTEAEAEVKDLLKSAMKAVLLRQAVGELEGADRRPAPEVESTPTPAAPVEPTASYVYGIARANGSELPSGLTGIIDDAPVTVVTEVGLAAITSTVRLKEFEQAAIDERVKDLAWVEQKVNAHDRVVKAAMLGAVIPCRFCTVLSDEEEVRQLLRRHAAAIRQTLDRLEGRREWGVKAVFAPETVDGRDDEEKVTAAAGKSYLLHKRRQGLRRSESLREAEAAAEECHRTLSVLAADAAMLPTRDRGDDTGGKLLLNGAYLVPDSDLHAFDAALDELRARHGGSGLTLSRTGPWPPYNFARLSLTLEPEPPRQPAPDAQPEAAA